MSSQRTILTPGAIEQEVNDFVARERIDLPNGVTDMCYEIVSSVSDLSDIFAIQRYLYRNYVPLRTRVRRKIALLFSPIAKFVANKNRTVTALNTNGLRPAQEWIPIAFTHLGYSDHTILKFVNDPALLKFVQVENYGESLEAVRFSIVLSAVKLYMQEQVNYKVEKLV